MTKERSLRLVDPTPRATDRAHSVRRRALSGVAYVILGYVAGSRDGAYGDALGRALRASPVGLPQHRCIQLDRHLRQLERLGFIEHQIACGARRPSCCRWTATQRGAATFARWVRSLPSPSSGDIGHQVIDRLRFADQLSPVRLAVLLQWALRECEARLEVVSDCSDEVVPEPRIGGKRIVAMAKTVRLCADREWLSEAIRLVVESAGHDRRPGSEEPEGTIDGPSASAASHLDEVRSRPARPFGWNPCPAR
jgi:hypothetical protein